MINLAAKVVALWILFQGIVLGSSSSIKTETIRNTLNMIEENVSLGSELRGKLEEASTDDRVTESNLLFKVVDDYADEQEHEYLKPFVWFISAELMRTIYSELEPSLHYRVLDELKTNFDPLRSKKDSSYFYICYQLIAKIIWMEAYKEKIVRLSLPELEVYFDSEEDKAAIHAVYEKCLDILYPFQKKRGATRKISSNSNESEGHRSDDSEDEYVELFDEFYGSNSDSSSERGNHLDDKGAKLILRSPKDVEFYGSKSDSSSERGNHLDDKGAKLILRSPKDVLEALPGADIRRACEIYLRNEFNNVSEEILEEINSLYRDVIKSALDK